MVRLCGLWSGRLMLHALLLDNHVGRYHTRTHTRIRFVLLTHTITHTYTWQLPASTCPSSWRCTARRTPC